ncbi:hypothetical protein [Sinomonas sp. ASV322]|uniref:hypothetical protein n=1 Tax=Sinomonas sp. ASV322 TaxID=3041920 RepID=UPI0027DB1BCF|nr:hypothetical protein [Sinomonas sp. ASV322]MDQ4501252.1 hypothetical protein [Sinomonas sp. ASV322]
MILVESAEHAWIGDHITLKLEGGAKSAADTPLPVGTGTLTYGQCIALGGDFYGVVGSPISTSADPRAAFAAAFQTLVQGWDQIPGILSIMQEEIDAVAAAQNDGRDPSMAYAQLGDSLSKRWNRATGGGSEAFDLVPMGRYLKLAAENWDHFAPFAVKAYEAGHAAAMDTAAGGDLEGAYAMNAFADHFLTDLFSAGHVRAPRKELHDQVTTPMPGFSGTLGSLLARCMHDEDSSHGLKVTNKMGTSWTAYGDKRLLDFVSAQNRDVVVAAVQQSADEVWSAYQKTGESAGRALDFVPRFDLLVADPTSRDNSSPLFTMQNDVVARRNNVADRADYSWTTDWWGWSTFALLMETHDYETAKVYNNVTGDFLGWLGCSSGNYVTVEKDEANASKVAWHFDGKNLYLRTETSGGDRFLGLSDRSYAGWGLNVPTGWWNPVVYARDMTIGLAESPRRILYLYDGQWVCWSDENSEPQDVIRVDLPLTKP